MENFKSKSVLREGIDFILKSIFDEIKNPKIKNWESVKNSLSLFEELLKKLYAINLDEYYDRELYLKNKKRSEIRFNSKNVEKAIKERMNDLQKTVDLYIEHTKGYDLPYIIVIEQKNDILGKYINAGNKICQFIDNDAKKSLKEIINSASLLIEVTKKYIPVDWRK